MLLAISITVAVVFLGSFIMSVRAGQYDDAYTPSVRILFDDELLTKSQEKDQIEDNSIT